VSDAARPRHAYRWFAAAAASWFFGWTIQGVIFTWLVIDDAKSAASALGTVQTVLALPGPLIALLGGALADRLDRRAMLVAGHAGMFALSLLLALGTRGGTLSLAAMLGYALCAGALQGMVLPTRQAFLTDVAGSDLLRAVTLLTVVQSSAQVAGPLTGAATTWLGVERGLVLQAVVFLAGAAALRFTPRTSSHEGSSAARATAKELLQGFRDTIRARKQRAPLLAATAHALGYVGPLYVLLPLLVRDVYGGGIGGIGVAAALFPAGIVLGSILSLRGARRGLHRGTMMLAGLGAAGILVALLGAAPPMPVLYLAIPCWGGAASVVFNTSRTLVQETAEPSMRARAAGLLMTGTLLAGPVSSFVAGTAAHLVGPRAACAVFGMLMAGSAVALWPSRGDR
jgi:MFS family permease